MGKASKKLIKNFKELGFKEFMKRWGKGMTEITPKQQTQVTLWSFLPIFGGMGWGLVITFMAKTYWLSLILAGSLPITSIQFISNLQKYKSQKKIEEIMESAK
jgi:hypothetical protein